MPVYKGGAHVQRWKSQLLDGSANTATKPVVIIYQNGSPVTIDPSRVLHSANGWWSVSLSSLEMAFDYIDFDAQHASLIGYSLSIRTDDATAAIFTMATDFTNVVRGHILTILGAVVVGGVSVMQRIGGLTGTGINTVYGMFLALFNKTATKPTDVGGTYDPATDSLEALRDRGDAAWVTGGGGGGGGTSDTMPKLNSTGTVLPVTTAIIPLTTVAGKKINLQVISGEVYIFNASTTPARTSPSYTVKKDMGIQQFEITDLGWICAADKAQIIFTVEN